MKHSPIVAVALLAQPLTDKFSENVRYFIPAELIPVAPGSARARKVGLKKYRGANRGPGFVIQSSQLLTTLLEIFAALDYHFPEGGPHAVRSDGPLCVPVVLSAKRFDHFVEVCQESIPSMIDNTSMTSIVSIPSSLLPLERDKAIRVLLDFPDLCEATVRRLDHDIPRQFYGLELLIRRDDDAQAVDKHEADVSYHCNLITYFLSREEPLRR